MSKTTRPPVRSSKGAPETTKPERDELRARIQRDVAEFEVEAAKTGLYHRGYRFWPPYACGRCGVPISASQFAFSRSCGGCDRGESLTARFHPFDARWFVLGKAELENAADSGLIHPEFIPASQNNEFPEVYRPRPRPIPKPYPKPYPRIPKPRRGVR